MVYLFIFLCKNCRFLQEKNYNNVSVPYSIFSVLFCNVIQIFLSPVKFLLVACEIWTPVGIRTPDNNWDLESKSLESRISSVQDCLRVLSICQNSGQPDHCRASQLANEIRFLLKNHLLCVYYLGFDWSGWRVLIKSEILIMTGIAWFGRFVLTNEKVWPLPTLHGTMQWWQVLTSASVKEWFQGEGQCFCWSISY